MKFSYQWISELVPHLHTDPAELERLITMKTAECEGIEPAASDWIIEIDNKSLTHRPDLWGHYGLAHEVAAISGLALRDPVRPELLPTGHSAIRVKIEDYDLCPRYSALVFDHVTVVASPDWLGARLDSIGLNPISNIVDATNYILAELPQPMHAFDADKLAGGTIFVRKARRGENLKALNGETYAFAETDLVIADSDGPVALAGVIGGAHSAISPTTKRIVLESANFNAASVRLTSARHKLRTDASMRFEKSLDPENTLRGLARAIEILAEVSPGIRTVGGVVDNGVVREVPKRIQLTVDFVNRKLGKTVSPQEIKRILEALGFRASETPPGVLSVSTPSWRATKDISLKDDLVEEIGRMVGYDSITPKAPLVESIVPPSNPMRSYLRAVRGQLTAQGFTEIYNYSFVSEAEAARFECSGGKMVAIRNPIASDLTHLRRSLLPGLFRNILSNVRNYPEFRLFEIGNEIHPQTSSQLPEEILHCAAVLYSAHGDERDFFELKRVAECLFAGCRVTAAQACSYEHPARTAEIYWQDALIGRLFELHPSLLEAEGIEGRAVLFDVNLKVAQALTAARTIKYTPLRKYPTSGFDLSVVTALEMPVAQIQDALMRFAGDDLVNIEFIRQYDGPPLAEGQKSVTYHLSIGALDHTLSAEEASEVRNRIIEGMRGLGFEFRA